MRNFDFSDMGPDNQVLFFKRAYKLRSDFWLDRLDCSVSFHRQKVEGATFEDAMGFFGNWALSSMILRAKHLGRSELPYYEVGFRDMGREVDHFLYILVDVAENGDELVECFLQLGGKRCS